DHHREVERQRGWRNRDGLRRNQRGQTQYAEQIENVAADDVADRDVAFTANGRQNRGGQLGQRSADRDHGQADHQLRQPQRTGQRYRAFDEEVRAHHQQHQPADHQGGVDQAGIWLGGLVQAELLGEFVVGRRGIFPAAADDQEQRVGDDGGEQQDAIQAAERAVQRQSIGRQAGANHDRHIQANQLTRNDQWSDQ